MSDFLYFERDFFVIFPFLVGRIGSRLFISRRGSPLQVICYMMIDNFASLQIAKQCHGYTGADIASLCAQAARHKIAERMKVCLIIPT